MGASPRRAGLAGVEISLPDDAVGTDVMIGLRAEQLDLGEAAASREISLPATILDVQYRGALVDHLLRLTDGQELTVTSTNRRAHEGEGEVRVGFDTDHMVVLLE